MIGYSSSKILGGLAAMVIGCLVAVGPVAAQGHCKDVSGLTQQEVEVAKLQLRADLIQHQQQLISGHSSLSAAEGDERVREIIRRDLNGYAPPMTFEIERTDTSALLCASPFQS